MKRRRRAVIWSHGYLSADADGYLTKNRVGEVIERLPALGWDVTFVARLRGPAPFLTHRLGGGLRVIPISLSSPNRHPRGLLTALRTVARADAALVFMPTVFNALLVIMLGRRAVLYAGSAWAELPGAKPWRWRLEQLATGRAGHVITAGEGLRGLFAGRALSLEACVPMVPIEVGERLRAGATGARQKDRESLRVLFVGSVGQRKGVPQLLTALEALPDIEVMIVGPRPDAELDARLTALEAGRENITTSGYVEWDELRTFYEWANVLILPSFAEGFPRVVYEATAFGVALVLTPVGGVPDLLKDGRDALFVPFGDADAIVTALRRLQLDPGLQLRLTESARGTVAPVFRDPDPAAQFSRALEAVAVSRA